MGQRNGYGVYTYPNGDKYEGEWRDGRRHGQGEYIYKDQGLRYKGGFIFVTEIFAVSLVSKVRTPEKGWGKGKPGEKTECLANLEPSNRVSPAYRRLQ